VQCLQAERRVGNPKAEGRNSKETRNPKSEVPLQYLEPYKTLPGGPFRPLAALSHRRSGSDFGLLSSFDLRIS